MASGMIYSNPFGAAAEGQQAGINQALTLGKAARDFRDADMNYDFRKWYDPYMRKLAQSQAAYGVDEATQNMLKNAANVNTYTGNPALLNQRLHEAYGADYGTPLGTRTPVQNTFAADVAFGRIPAPYAYGITGTGRNGRYGYPTAADPNAELRAQADRINLENYIKRMNGQGGYQSPMEQLQKFFDPGHMLPPSLQPGATTPATAPSPLANPSATLGPYQPPRAHPVFKDVYNEEEETDPEPDEMSPPSLDYE